jgi:hypothetical protein
MISICGLATAQELGRFLINFIGKYSFQGHLSVICTKSVQRPSTLLKSEGYADIRNEGVIFSVKLNWLVLRKRFKVLFYVMENKNTVSCKSLIDLAHDRIK